MKKILILVFLLIPLTSLGHIPTQVDGKTFPSLAPMLQKVTPAVVNIMVEKKQTFVTESERETPFPSSDGNNNTHTFAVGSGVIINSKEGLIITNAHVVNQQKLMIVTLKDGRHYRATLVGKDDGFDIAVLHIKASNLQAIPFGDSDKLQVGNFVAAIGSPFGLTQTVTSGVISALNRSEPKIEGFQSFIQTDAPINPGNSGGALVNLQGELIGMNTAIISPGYGNIGIGFSIPSNMIQSVVTQLIRYGQVKRGMLGVIAQNISPTLASAFHIQPDQGVIVTKVVPGSAAQKAGIKSEDIILEINNKKIQNSVQLRNMLGIMRPGTSLKILISRNQTQEILKVTVGDPKKIEQQITLPFLSGLRLQNFKELEADGQEIVGVLVTDVSPDSQGMLAGLNPGDVITTANTEPVDSIKTLTKIVLKHPKQLLLSIARGDGNLFIVIEPEED